MTNLTQSSVGRYNLVIRNKYGAITNLVSYLVFSGAAISEVDRLLEIRNIEETLHLFWPFSARDFSVEWTDKLTAGFRTMSLSRQTNFSTGSFEANVPDLDSAQFFRLRR
jgi:hypothetical protein